MVQKRVDDAWRNEASQIYSGYDLYHQAVGGAEQAVFDQKSGASASRSTRILESIPELGRFTAKARVLDVGCGSGAMLRALSSFGRGWELHGQEPNVKSRESLLGIPGVRAIHSSSVRDIAETFDFVSIIHALEHIETPAPFLVEGIGKLKPDGLLLIQVPYFPDNPFDLLIADHCTHFTVSTLLRTLADSGLEPVSARTDVVHKELTVIAKRALKDVKVTGRERPADIDVTRRLVIEALGWLNQVLSDARNVAQSANFGLFGTSISANWLLGELDSRVRFFVDEDPNRVGSTYRGRPVFHPRQTPPDSDVYMVLPRLLAEQILARLQPKEARYHMGPEYQGWYTEPPFPTSSVA